MFTSKSHLTAALLHTFAMMLSLSCYLLDDDLKRYFIVEVEETKTVSILKDLIKEEKAPKLNDVAASDLDVWKVNLPTPLLKKDLDELKLDDNNSLLPHDELSEVFGTPGPALKHVHIVFKRPSVKVSIHSSFAFFDEIIPI